MAPKYFISVSTLDTLRGVKFQAVFVTTKPGILSQIMTFSEP